MITKEDFVKIIDLYYPTMRYYQLIKLYFSIIDKSNPYFYHPYYCKKNFRMVHSNHHTYNSCCSYHQNKVNLQNCMKKKLNGSNYEKKIYKRACKFFLQVNTQVVIYNFKKIDDYKDISSWNFIYNNFKIKRSGLLFRINDTSSIQ